MTVFCSLSKVMMIKDSSMKALIFPSLKRGAFFVFSALLVSFAAGQAQSGTISGRVTGPNGTTPLEEIEVTAYRWNDHFWDSVDYRYRAGWEWVNSDGTDVNGNYSIPDLAAGRYRIEFADSY